MSSFDDLVASLLEDRRRGETSSSDAGGYSTMTFGPDLGDRGRDSGSGDIGSGNFSGGYWDSNGAWIPSNSNGGSGGVGSPSSGGGSADPVIDPATGVGGSSFPAAGTPLAGGGVADGAGGILAGGAGAGAAAGAGSAAGSAAGNAASGAASGAGGILGSGLSWADLIGGVVSALASPGNQSQNTKTNATTTETNTYDPRRGQYLDDLESELYGGGRSSQFVPSTPYTPPPTTGTPPPTSGGGGPITGGPRSGGGSPPVVQPTGGATTASEVMIPTPMGFWANERGNPNTFATVGSNHTSVHFGADGYIDRYRNPGSSNGAVSADATWQPFNGAAYAAQAASQSATQQPSTPYTPPPAAPAAPYSGGGISQSEFMSTQPGGYSQPAGSNLGMQSMTAIPETQMPERGTPTTVAPRGDTGGTGTPTGTGNNLGLVPRMPVVQTTATRPATTTVPFDRPYDSTPRITQPGEGYPGTPGPVTPVSGPGLQPPTGPPYGGGNGGASSDGPYQWGQGGALGNRNAAGGTAYDAYGNMIAHPDMDPQTRNAIQQEALNSARAGYAGYGNQMSRRQAATGNSAGYAAGISDLARRASSTYGSITRQNLVDFERERQRRYETGVSGMMGLYGGETSYASNLFNQRGQALNQPTSRNTTTVGTGNVVHNSGSLFSRIF